VTYPFRRQQKLIFTLAFSVCFACGLALFYSTFKNPQSREIASADGQIYQLRPYNSEQITNYLQKNIHIQRSAEGNKLINFKGLSAALCSTYPEITAQFYAEGVAVDGEAPLMNLTSHCRADSSGADIAAITLPLPQILSAKPTQSQFEFTDLKVSFEHVDSTWPRQWVLRKIEFKTATDSQNKSAVFSRSPASTPTTERPIVLEF
jgi:hypothetical protein